MPSQDCEPFLTWARYLYWADVMRRHWDTYMTHHGQEPDIAEWLGTSAYWYASLYVVVEGWEAQQLKDPIIDALLTHSAGFRDRLRRYRNAVFHYTTSLTEPRLVDFMKDGEAHLLWTLALHDEFCRFYREWVHNFTGTEDQKGELRKSIADIVGWVPPELGLPQVELLRTSMFKVERLIASAGPDSPPTEGLRDSLREVAAVIQKVEKEVHSEREERLRRFGIVLPSKHVN